MKQRNGSGFTLVELIITMVIMTILMALGTVLVSSQQGQARDKERQADIESLARGLEARYANGNPKAVESVEGQTEKGIYPGINEIFHASGFNKPTYTPSTIPGGYMTDLLPGTSKATFDSPNKEGAFVVVCAFSCQPAGNQAQINAAFNNQDLYVYEPVNTNNEVCCCGDCYKFNLYWKDESGTIQKVTSKHQ